jgi:hypothetical protein
MQRGSNERVRRREASRIFPLAKKSLLPYLFSAEQIGMPSENLHAGMIIVFDVSWTT